MTVKFDNCRGVYATDKGLWSFEVTMSRSRKKQPFVVIAGANRGKPFRRSANRAMRARVRAALSQGDPDLAPVRLEEVSNVYDYRDWIRYVTSDDSEWMQEFAKKTRRK